MKLFAQAPLRTNAGAISDRQHPAHQFRINLRSTDITVKWRQVLPDLLKVDKPVNRPEQVVSRDVPLKRKLIEQSSLFDLPMSHHDLQSCQLDGLNH
jgi:hypothetical protein